MKQKVFHSETDYFKSYSDYFWSWDDNGEVITCNFSNSTISYREDLCQLLEESANSITPHLGSVLLILYACTDGYRTFTHNYIKRIIKDAEDDDSVTREILEYYMIKACKLLEKIHDLPIDLKTGQKRVLLLTSVLKNNTNASEISSYKNILKSFGSGNFDEISFNYKRKVSYSEVFSDFYVIANAESQYASVETLKEKLETGVPPCLDTLSL